MKKKSYKKRKRQIKTKRNKKGGSYYVYNKNPLRFTSTTSRMGGGLSLDTRNTLLPQSFVNVGRMFGDVFTSSSATTTGSASLIPSDPTSQPIDSKTPIWNKI